MREMSRFEDLIDDVVVEICSFLGESDGGSFAQVNKMVRNATLNLMRRRKWQKTSVKDLCIKGDVDGVRYKIEAEPSWFYFDFGSLDTLRFVCVRYEQVPVLRYILQRIREQYPMKDMRQSNETAACNAAHDGKTEVVKFFLEEEGVDPVYGENILLREASFNGQSRTVKYLVSLPQVQTSVIADDAIRLACRRDYIETVELLLKLPGVNKKAAVEEAFLFAHSYMVRFLIGAGVEVEPEFVAELRGRADLIEPRKEILDFLETECQKRLKKRKIDSRKVRRNCKVRKL